MGSEQQPRQARPAIIRDAEARAFATDPKNNVVLEASAGTGKTSVLVARYLSLLRAGVDPSHILAITFTRKAAAEMRARIVHELRVAGEQSQADRARWRELRDRMGEIAIGTIDAFCLSLLREFPLEVDLDPGFALADETEVPRLIEQALDRTLRLSAGLAHDDPDVAMVLGQLGSGRARRGLGDLLRRRLVAPAALQRVLARGPTELSGERLCRRVVDQLCDLLETTPGGLARFLNDGPVGHPRYAMLRADLARREDLRRAESSTLRSIIDRVRDHFLTQEGEPRVKDPAYHRSHWTSATAWRRYRKTVVGLAPAVRDTIAAFDRDLNVVLARGVRRMFAIAVSEYRRALESRALLDFSDVLECALELLRQMDEFAQSRYKLESRYHHVLVDEFQDTSRAQWDLVSLLIQSWGEGFGLVHDAPLQPSVFLVGDRKQSIYRFRDAEVTVLREAGAYIESLRPAGDARRSISHSFRAVPELLAFVNDLFTAVDKVQDRDDGFTYDLPDRFPVEREPEDPTGSRDTRREGGRGGPILGLAVSDQVELCAQAVATEVERLLAEETVRDRQTGVAARITAGDIAILFRARESHREVERALAARNIPTYVYKGLGFFDADEVKDYCALLGFLAEPTSELRVAAFLRSRFVRLSDLALCQLAPALSAAVVASEPPATMAALPEEDRRVLTKLRASVPAWLSLVDRVTPAEVMDRVLSESAYTFELRGPHVAQARENLKKMRSLVRRIQNRGYATLSRLAEYVDQLSLDESNAIVDAVEAVSLMTVHAAKGLEFPVVFLVDMARGTRGVPQPIRVIPDRGDGHPSVSIGPFRSETDVDERVRDREETKRLLYVAATRARDRLYLSATLSQGELKAGRHSLAEVLPASVSSLCSSAASAPASKTVVSWTGPSGKAYAFSICRPAPVRPVQTAEPIAAWRPASAARPTAGEGDDDFDTLEPDLPLRRVTVTEWAAARAGPPHRGPGGPGGPDDGPGTERLAGTLVHVLLQRASRDVRDREEIRRRARALLRADEKAGVDNCDELVNRAVETYLAILKRPEVTSLIDGDCLFELPFSLRLDQSSDSPERQTSGAPVIVRGTIDCLARGSDGRLTVLEFKTGSRRPEHQAQLDLYVVAARGLFPGAAVEGVLIYA